MPRSRAGSQYKRDTGSTKHGNFVTAKDSMLMSDKDDHASMVTPEPCYMQSECQQTMLMTDVQSQIRDKDPKPATFKTNDYTIV